MELSRVVQEFADWTEYPNGHRELRGHSDAVTCAAVSWDGLWLYTGSLDESMVVWDLCKHKAKKKWQAHSRGVNCLVCRAGLLVSGGEDKKIRIWGAQELQFIHTLYGHIDRVYSVEVNRQGTRVLSGSVDRSVRLWSVKSGKCLRVLVGHTHFVRSVKYVGKVVVSGSSDQSVKLWNPRNSMVVRSVTDGIDEQVSDLQLNCDASLIACLFERGFTVFRWPEMTILRKTSSRASFGAWHPLDPRLLAVGHRTIRIYDVRRGCRFGKLKGHSKAIRSLCFSPDGSRLVSVSEDKMTIVWDLTLPLLSAAVSSGKKCLK